MTDYAKTTNFQAKDALPSGDANKVIKGTEFEAEFNNIVTAVASKIDKASPTFTGTVNFLSQGDLRLQDASGGQYVALQAPATVGTSFTLTLPTDSGNANQYLQTNGAGVLGWGGPTREAVSVIDFGADPTGVNDSTVEIQAAIDYVENTLRYGGIVHVPKGSYRCSAMIRVGGWVTLRGEGRFSSSLFWDSSYTFGNCIELGPDESGIFVYSGSYTFGTRIESLDLNATSTYRGENKALVYTVGAHQFSGLYDVAVRNFTSYGVHNDLATGGQACFILSNVELQASDTLPTLGNRYGLVCSGSGAFIKADSLTIQGGGTNKLEQGIRMIKDHLVLSGCHFEHCDVGIYLGQNESTVRNNSIIGVTGHNSVPDLILAGLTTNLEYNLSSVNNLTTNGSISLNVLRDLKSGVTVGGLGGLSLNSYTNTPLPLIWTVKTTTYTAVNGDQLIANHASTPFTVTLPASPSVGDSVTLKNVGAALLTVGRNSQNINSAAADATMPTGNAAQLVYVDVTIGWKEL